MRRAAVAALLVLVPLALGGCGDDADSYCGAVREHQQALAGIVGSGDPDALLQALDILEDLQDEAPGDITDEWQQVVSRIRALQDALDAAGVDPATYDRDDPPAGLSEAQRTRIDAAAADLGGGTTLRALQDLDQQARDVCKTPLTS